MRRSIGSWALVVVMSCAAERESGPSAGSAAAGQGGMASGGSAGMLAGGGGSGGANAGGSGGANAGGSGGSSVASEPTFTRVWSEVLSGKGCAGEFCHGSGTGTLAMDDKSDAYLNLVGVPAQGPQCAQSGQLRVSPGKPEESLLLHKMSTLTPSCGDPMPIGVRFAPNCLSPSPAVCTTAGEIELVRGWIAAGALDD